MFLTVFDGLNIIQSLFGGTTTATTETAVLVATDTSVPAIISSQTEPSTGTASLTNASTSTPSPVSPTIVPVISPVPGIYPNSILVFDQNDISVSDCFTTETNLALGLKKDEGLTRRLFDNNWRFAIESGRTAEDFIQVDFSQFVDVQQVKAIALNARVRLEGTRKGYTRSLPERSSPERIRLLYPEYNDGQRREYTIWIDKEENPCACEYVREMILPSTISYL